MKHSPNLLRTAKRSAGVLIALGGLGLTMSAQEQGTAVKVTAAEAIVAPPPTVAETTSTLPPTTTTLARVVIKRASRGAVQPRPRVDAPIGCENYRSIFEQYPWPVDQAMFTAGKESGCDPNKISATDDWGIMQLHNIHVLDPAENIAIGYGKYHAGRVGEDNFSAWYAVCTAEAHPQPKYEGIDCQ